MSKVSVAYLMSCSLAELLYWFQFLQWILQYLLCPRSWCVFPTWIPFISLSCLLEPPGRHCVGSALVLGRRQWLGLGGSSLADLVYSAFPSWRGAGLGQVLCLGVCWDDAVGVCLVCAVVGCCVGRHLCVVSMCWATLCHCVVFSACCWIQFARVFLGGYCGSVYKSYWSSFLVLNKLLNVVIMVAVVLFCFFNVVLKIWGIIYVLHNIPI